MGLNFSLTFVYVSLLIFNFSQTQSIKVKTEESLPDMIKRYLAGVKTELLEQRSSVHRNTADNEKYNQPRITLPDGMNPEPAVGPGNPPRSVLQLTSKRSGNEQAYDLTCKAHEWFIFTDDMPACVNPVWEGGYDPTFCAKVKSGWVYCGCDKNQVPGMKEGLDTCINLAEISNGRCVMNPCPEPFKCEEKVSERRFDCVRGNLKVPTWY